MRNAFKIVGWIVGIAVVCLCLYGAWLKASRDWEVQQIIIDGGRVPATDRVVSDGRD